jgi:heme-degrading monooxygenase HmoA
MKIGRLNLRRVAGDEFCRFSIFHSDSTFRSLAHPFRRTAMIVEVRSYRIKPGRREEFIEFFASRSIPALRAHGMKVLGPLLDIENPNKFVWLRMFPSLEAREQMRDAFYGGELWKNELEAIAMPMLESYDVILCETSPGCVFDVPH